MTMPTGAPTQSVVPPVTQSVPGVVDPNVVVPPVDPNAVVTPPVVTDKDTYTKAEYEALQARMAASDRTANAKAAELKKLQDAQLTEQQRKDKELKEAQEKAVELAARVTEQALENAFLKDTTYDWHNADAALKLLEREGLVVGDDGKVTGMKAAIDKLASGHAYLVKPGTSGTPATPATPQGSTGTTGTTRQHGEGTSKAEWEKKFPAMRGRVS